MPGFHNSEYNQAEKTARASSPDAINRTFNKFLHLQDDDRTLLLKYQQTLMKGADVFATVFYDYLMTSSATSQVLTDFQSKGGKISHLVNKQIQHLFGFLSGQTDSKSAQRMMHIGSVHLQYRIEPVWIMGAYKLYLDHLQANIRNNPKIDDKDRVSLENTITTLLFRDMGLMLEGYWDANTLALSRQKQKVTSLKNQMTSLLKNIPQLLWSIDIIHNKPLYVSPTSKDICGMDIDSPIPCLSWTVPEDKPKVLNAWQSALQGETVEVESRVAQPNGERRWFRRIFYPYCDSSGKVIRVDGLMEDTTEAKATFERLNMLATTDSLTGLTNRTLFHDRLSQAIQGAKRHNDYQVVVMLIDLDRFKEINDTLGHHAGDEILVSVTMRLQTLLRSADTLARLGGDEFAILLPDTFDGRQTAIKIAEKIQQAFVKPFYYNDIELFLGASIGIAMYPEHGDTVTTLMSHADVAMYSTKGTEISYKIYHSELNPNAHQHLQLSSDLRHALKRNEFILHYQPKIDLKSNTVMGAEALIRWHHPTLGLVPPDDFISLAERTGLIIPITEWVIENALLQSKVWLDAGYQFCVAINLSVRSFQSNGLVEKIAHMLKKIALPANLLEIEITENILISDINNISTILKKISALGVTITIDDFGTGYSSLAYLKTLPLDTLKIDKSFVMDMANDANDVVIVRSTIDLAHNLGFDIVAEGIENAETAELLLDLGCNAGQGYYFSEPKPAEDFLDYAQMN